MAESRVVRKYVTTLTPERRRELAVKAAKARAAALTPERRREIAKMGGRPLGWRGTWKRKPKAKAA